MAGYNSCRDFGGRGCCPDCLSEALVKPFNYLGPRYARDVVFEQYNGNASALPIFEEGIRGKKDLNHRTDIPQDNAISTLSPQE